MTKASDNVYPRFLISEGGSTSTPSAGRVTAYAKADGLLYSKDDAGTEKLLSSGPAGGTPSGTSNPVAPASGDQFFRSDLGLDIYYNGTRWLCKCPHYWAIGTVEADGLFPLSANSTIYNQAAIGVDRDVWLVKWFVATNVITTNDGTKFWTVTLRDTAPNTIASFDTSADTAGTKTNHEAAIGALLGTTSPEDLWTEIRCVKTSTPGSMYITSSVEWRLVVA